MRPRCGGLDFTGDRCKKSGMRKSVMPGVLRFSVALAAMFVLAACSSDDGEVAYVERPPEVIYNDALDSLQDGNYKKASSGFDEVERQHPYSVWATKAQLMAAFSAYQDNNYELAVLAAQRFIRLHPGNKDVPYAYYLIAISYYEQISDVGRDQENTKQALSALEELVRRFPESKYARDARLKIDLARDHLGGKEMEIGRYYLNQRQYVAAINRFRVVIENYQTTTHAPEALHRLTEAYLALGVTDEAQTAGAVLGFNYPDSDWYQDSYALLTESDLELKASQDSWITRAWKQVF